MGLSFGGNYRHALRSACGNSHACPNLMFSAGTAAAHFERGDLRNSVFTAKVTAIGGVVGAVLGMCITQRLAARLRKAAVQTVRALIAGMQHVSPLERVALKLLTRRSQGHQCSGMLLARPTTAFLAS